MYLILGTKVEHNDYTGFELQPAGRVSWTTRRGGTLWAAVSRAVRTPSRIDRELFVPGQPPYLLEGGPDFRSEDLLAYELGYRVQAQDRLRMTLATFYNRYDHLRSVEMVNPPAPLPIILANGLEGKSYGAELTADYRLTNTWQLRAGYTEMRVRTEAKPGSTDTTRASSDPDRQLSLRSSLDLPAQLKLDADARYVGAIENLEHETEALLQLGLPLLDHGRRRGNDDRLRLLPQEQLPRDQPRLDRLAQPRVVGDEEVDARESERLAERLHLVGVDLDPSAEGRLEEVRVGGRDAIPPERVKERRELVGWVTPAPRRC